MHSPRALTRPSNLRLATMAFDSASIATAAETASIISEGQSDRMSQFGSTSSLAINRDLMVGLTYNPVTSRLTAEIIKGANFSTTSKHPPGIQTSIMLIFT